MSPQVTVLEEITLVAPLGLRFWDLAGSAPAEPGLTVAAYPDGLPELRTAALSGPGLVYSFRALPGLQDVEHGTGDDAFWRAHPARLPFTIAVTDPQDRYLPFRLSALLPWRGLYGFFAGSPPVPLAMPDATWIPLFSAPSRPFSGLNAVVHAELRDDTTGQPASFAVVTARAPGLPLAVGVADVRGVVSVSLPYPEPRNTLFSSPLGGGPTKLAHQTWPVAIHVQYARGAAQGGTARLPDLEQAFQQGDAVAWRDTAHSAPAAPFTLEFGRDLVLRSLDSASGRELPVLLVTPMGSPL